MSWLSRLLLVGVAAVPQLLAKLPRAVERLEIESVGVIAIEITIEVVNRSHREPFLNVDKQEKRRTKSQWHACGDSSTGITAGSACHWRRFLPRCESKQAKTVPIRSQAQSMYFEPIFHGVWQQQNPRSALCVGQGLSGKSNR